MTDDQINIAIAENVLGWRQSVAGHPQSGNLVVVWTDNKSNFCHFRKPAKFCNDLNAMREAEQKLWSMNWELRFEFIYQLAKVVNPIHGYRMQEGIDLLDATARQRAEALLKTIGKWEESE
jgi:hypothetical protein